MNSIQRRNTTLTSFIGDALSLGSHWVYSQSEIAERAGDIKGYIDPLSEYHPGKKAGDFTHYGDQVLVLLRSIVEAKRFDLGKFAQAWRSFWEDGATISYRDGGTKAALQNLVEGMPPESSGSPSIDISGATRIAPLFLLDWDSADDLLSAVKAQAMLSHGDPAGLEAAEFFARVVLLVGSGESVPTALRSVADLDHWKAISRESFAAAVKSSSSGEDPLDSAREFGLTCHTTDAFPVICDLLLRYPSDPVTALTVNAKVGGDTSARGMIMGMVYGALPEAAALPEDWFSGMSARDEIEQLITVLS